MNPAAMYNKASLEEAVTALTPQSVTDNVAVTSGPIVNRFRPAVSPTPANTMNSGAVLALSANLVIQGSYTVASGAGGDALTVTYTVLSGNKSDMSDGTTFQTGSVAVPWKSNATLRDFAINIPLNFLSAGQYVQLSSLKFHGVSAGGTYSAEVAAANFNLGGLTPAPTPLYADAGWLSENT